MEIVRKVFSYPVNEYITMITDIAGWITNYSQWIIYDTVGGAVQLYNEDINCYLCLSIDNVNATVLDTLISTLPSLGGYRMNTGQVRLRAGTSTPYNMCQLTAFIDGDTCVISYAPYNDLSSVSAVHGGLFEYGLFLSGLNLVLISVNDGLLINQGNITPLISNVPTPLGTMYVANAYIGTLNAFTNDIAPMFKSFTSDGNVQNGKSYIAEGKTYFCLSSTSRIMIEY